jgi:PAS domain S-box-containing protein
MRSFRDISIRRKLTVMSILASGTALLLACAAFLAYELFAYRDGMIRFTSIRADIIGTNSASAILFNDENAAAETLAALKADPHVIDAGIYTQDNKLFATYVRSEEKDTAPHSLRFADHPAGYWFEEDGLILFRKIMLKGEPIGTVYIHSDLNEMYARIWQYLGISIAVLLASSSVALVISSRLQRGITQPLFHLVETAKAVSSEKDYSVRAVTDSKDEMGVLVRAFNEMLANIEQSQEMRDKLAAIVESSDDAIIGKSLDSIVTSWNRGAERIFGYSAEEILGKPITILIPPDRLEEEPQVIERLKRGEWIDHFETIRRRKDGQAIPVSLTISPIKNADGKVIGISKIVRDITEQKRAEKEIQTLNAELEQRVIERTAQLEASNKELEAFSYSVSHDLRAPLRHIDGFSDLLQEHITSTLDEKGRRYLKTISQSAKQMGNLIDDLLAFSRVGRVELRLTTVGLNQVVGSVQDDLAHDTQGRRIAWTIGMLPTVHGDPSMLRQVLFNLMANAVKYTRAREEARIEIGSAAGNSNENEKEIVIFVRDNGAGFDMQYVNKLFGVFQRLHSASEFEGTGIGLANVQRIIHRHGGRVWAEGAVDVGATFYFSLPARKEASYDG